MKGRESNPSTNPPMRDGANQSVASIRNDLSRAILDGVWLPGQPISQVQLSTALGISRGKLREALRMLQEEGLVEGKEFQRLRVAEFHVEDLDSMYALRIMVESLGATMTVPRLAAVDKVRLAELAKQLRTSRRKVDESEWNHLHDIFHDIVAGRGGGPVGSQMRSFSARSERYRRLYFRAVEKGLASKPSEHEHRRLADAAIGGDVDGIVATLACHYARTASSILQMMAPEGALQAVPAALSLLNVAPDPDLAFDLESRAARDGRRVR